LFDFQQETEDEFQTGFVHSADTPEILNPAELAQALGIEPRRSIAFRGSPGRLDPSLLLIVQDGEGIDPRQSGDDINGDVQRW
jgi:hypothetical protein